MPAADVLEGTWEDIVRHADRLAGKRVRLVVVDSGEAASPMAAASGERERAWNEWCAAPRPKTPPLSEEAISRESTLAALGTAPPNMPLWRSELVPVTITSW